MAFFCYSSPRSCDTIFCFAFATELYRGKLREVIFHLVRYGVLTLGPIDCAFLSSPSHSSRWLKAISGTLLRTRAIVFASVLCSIADADKHHDVLSNFRGMNLDRFIATFIPSKCIESSVKNSEIDAFSTKKIAVLTSKAFGQRARAPSETRFQGRERIANRLLRNSMNMANNFVSRIYLSASARLVTF